MRRAKTKKVWVLFGAALIVAFGLVLAFRTGVHHDPAGISRRPPYSMHAHQSEWTLKSHPGKSPLQSPISLNTTKLATHRESPLQVQIAHSKAELLDVGHTFQIRYPPSTPGATAQFEGNDFDLRQFHFHKPSEHLIDGKQYEMEAHYVFINKNKTRLPKALVIGVMILDGPFNPEIAKIWKHLPPYREGYGESESEISNWQDAVNTHELDVDTHGHYEKTLATGIDFNLQGMLPAIADLMIYDGSLTTPFCDEGVTHAVALSPAYMQHEQVEHFEGYYEGNNRDPQPLGDAARRNFRRSTINFR